MHCQVQPMITAFQENKNTNSTFILVSELIPHDQFLWSHHLGKPLAFYVAYENLLTRIVIHLDLSQKNHP